jgi:hypothetical protein
MGSGFDDDIANLLNGLETYKKALTLVSDKQNYDGSMEKEYAERAATTANELQLLNNQVAKLAVNLGTALLPGLNAVLAPLGDMFGVGGKLAAKYPGLTKVVGGLAAGFLGLKVASLGTRIGWSYIRDGGSLAMDIFQRLRPSVIQNAIAMARLAGNGSAFSGLFANLAGGIGKFRAGCLADLGALKTGFMSLWGVIAAHPFIAIGAAVAIAATLIYAYWEPIKEFLGKIWESVKPHWENFKNFVGGVWEGTKELWNSALAGLDKLITAPFETAFGWIESTIGVIGAAWEKFISIFRSDVGNLPQISLPSAEVQAAGPAAIHSHYVQSMGTPGVNALGGFINRPLLSWVGEDGPEYIVPVGSAYRERGRSLLGQAASALGMSVADRDGSEPAGSSENSPFANWTEKFRDLLPSPQPQTAIAGVGGGMNNIINIYSSPGMDEQALADEVIRRIEDLEARRRRGAYGDDAFFG